jgi:hypothetical protein
VRCRETKCPLLTVIFSLSLFFVLLLSLQGCYFSPRRSYCSVLKFVMEFLVTNQIRFGVQTNLGAPRWGAGGSEFLCSVLPPYLTLSVPLSVTIKFYTKDDWKTIGDNCRWLCIGCKHTATCDRVTNF